MRIVFGADLDDGGFPGPLAVGRAAAVLDESWVGVQGLVAILEVRLGLLRLDPPGQSERAAHLAKRLRDLAPPTTTTTWPWAKSLQVDPLSTARAVLRLKDALVLAGVDGSVDVSTLPPRLAAVHAAVVDIPPGIPERALAVVAALHAGEDPRIASLVLVDDIAMFPGLVRRLIGAIEKAGTTVTAWTPPATIDVDSTSDLARIRRNDRSEVTGDGSLILLRPDTIDEAAADIAALVTVTDNVLVIGGDIILDEALHRRGAPTLGLRGDVGTDALLALLPLVVALDDKSPDPERLFELLSLPLSPVPRDVAWRARQKLIDAPSASADAVVVAVVEGLDRLYERVAADKGLDAAVITRGDIAARLAALVPAWADALGIITVEADHAVDVDVARLRARLITLQRHLFGRQKDTYGDNERTPFQAALRQIGLCLRLLAALDVKTLSPPQLARLLDSATAGVRPQPTWPAEVGLARVQRPGAVCGPVDVVIWWNFTRESGRLPPRVLTGHEHAALLAAGFDPGAIDAVAGRFADAQRRPLQLAQSRLILCAPRRGANGREHHPHPLWDELMARIPREERNGAIKNLVRRNDDDASADRRGAVARVIVDRAVLPGPRRVHRFAAGSVLPREVTSPSREERLLGCGFQFVLHERGASARAFRLKRGPALEGDVVHAVLGEVLRRKRLDDVDGPLASTLARAIYDELVPKMAGAWTRPGREQVRLRVRERVARASTLLVNLLDHNGLQIVAVETEFEKEWSVPALESVPPSSRILQGTPDLVVDGDDSDGKPYRLIIDHKTGNDEARRAALRTGVPVQLLDYALLVGADQQRPAKLGYFQLRSGRLLTTMAGLIGAEHIVAERTAREGWTLLEHARRDAFAGLHRGEVEAPGAEGGNPGLAIVVDSAGLHLPAPCAYCRADALCGRSSPLWSIKGKAVRHG